MTYDLAPNAVFWTLQGEGALLGTPMCFVRLAGCSVGCNQCDTNYSFAERATTRELVDRIQHESGRAFAMPWVWITGGEPTDQNLIPLCQELKLRGFRLALATSGVRLLPRELVELLNWISVSPHQRIFEQHYGHELKVVPGLGLLTWNDVHEIRASFPYKFVQPMPKDLARAIEFVKTYPGWQLSPQAHKWWRLP